VNLLKKNWFDVGANEGKYAHANLRKTNQIHFMNFHRGQVCHHRLAALVGNIFLKIRPLSIIYWGSFGSFKTYCLAETRLTIYEVHR
jgi:hypothetical protein